MKTSLITALAVMLPTCALAAPVPSTPRRAPVEGVVVRVDGDEVVIDIGRAAGLPAGEPVHLFRRMVVQHPISGATIEDRFPIGAVTPAQVGDLLSIVRDVSGLDRPPVAGDFAVFRPPPPPPPVMASPAPGRPAEPDTAALEAIHAESLGQSLPRRIALYEGFVAAFPQSRHGEAVGRELVALRALLTQVQSPAAAAAPTTIAPPDGLTVRHTAPRPVIAGERVEVAVAIVEGERIVELRLLSARAGSESESAALTARPTRRVCG